MITQGVGLVSEDTSPSPARVIRPQLAAVTATSAPITAAADIIAKAFIAESSERNLKSTADAVVDVAVAEADVAAIIALAAVAAGDAPPAPSKSKCRIILKTADLRRNRNEN